MARLIRIMRVVRWLPSKSIPCCDDDIAPMDDTSEVVEQTTFRKQHSSKLARNVGDQVTKRVIIGLLLAVGLVPILSGVTEETYGEHNLSLLYFDSLIADTTTLNTMVALYLQEQPSKL